jgi:hypothetical protein
VKSIYDFVSEQRDSYRSDTVEITDGYEFSQHETLRTIELYHNSKFLSGNTDSLGREKPFYNICKFRVNVAVRATDLDTKDVQIQSDRITKTSYAESFLLNLKNRNWMRRSNFAPFLNKFGHTRAKYGGVIVKKTERDGELGIHVVPWLDIITDQIDIRSGVKIERHYYTPAELKTNAPKNWDNIDDAISAAQKSREAQAADADTKENKTPGDYIEVWEVHGVLPTRYFAGTNGYAEDYGEDNEYERQMHVIVLDESDKEKIKGVTLYAGIEDEDPYKYLAYEQVDGRGLGVGVVEDLFEAQVWTNYTEKQKKDMLDLAGKIIFQTTDQNIAAKNILTDLENGAIVTTSMNTVLSQVNNAPVSFAALEKVLADWNTQAERVSSTPPAITGESMPSGQPFRLGAMLNAEAGSLFEYRREEAGLFLQEIYFDWILPFLVKQIKKDKDLTATLEPEELELVADAIADHEADRFAKEQVLSGKEITGEQKDAVRTAVRDVSMKLRRRSFGGFTKLFKDWEGSVDVITTGEQKNKTAMLETLFNIFKTVASSPGILQDPVLARLFNQLVEMAGVSPLLLQPSASQQSASPAPQQTPPLPDKMAATV